MATAAQGLEGLLEPKEAIFLAEDVQAAIANCAKKKVGKSLISRLTYLKFVVQSFFSHETHRTPAAARTKYFESIARSYIGKTYVPINPKIRFIGRAISALFIEGSFSDSGVKVTGIDQLVDVPGKGEVSLGQLFAEGGVGVVSTHRMYFDIPNVAYVAGKLGIDNMYYLGGNNVPQLKGGILPAPLMKALGVPLFPVAKAWEALFRNSGAILFTRKFSKETAREVLLPTIDQAIVAYLLDKERGENRANVLTFIGNKASNGRHRDALIPEMDSIFTKPMMSLAGWIVPCTVISDIVPEDYAFAVEHEKSGQTMLTYLLKYTKWDHGYGKIRWHFCRPLRTSDYATKNSMEREVRRSLIENTPLIPTSALAATLKLYDVETFSASQIAPLVGRVINAARYCGVRISDELQDRESLQTVTCAAAMALTRQKMLKTEGKLFRLQEPRLRDFYANMAFQTLEAAGAVQAFAPGQKADKSSAVAYGLAPGTT